MKVFEMALPSSLTFVLQFSTFAILLLFPTSTESHLFPGLNPFGQKSQRDPSKSIFASSSLHSNHSVNDFHTKYYDQTLDHFNYDPRSYTTFKQKYVINYRFWGGASSNSPILAYFGDEEALGDDFSYIGILGDNVHRFSALLVYIEHRFYGESVPFGLSKEVMLKNESVRGYFSSAQTLADYAEILLHVKETFCAPKSPIIVVGGSYGGMLASWFRLKYPHIALGAVAVSAPILYFEDIVPQDAYFSVVQQDFKGQSETCFETIKESWDMIYDLASRANGLSFLSQKFNTCSQLDKVQDLSEFLIGIYSSAAQYDAPPQYPVKLVCDAINGAPYGADSLDRVFAGAGALYAYYGVDTLTCFNLTGYSDYAIYSWDWQTCSEMVIPIGGSKNISIVRAEPFNIEKRSDQCKKYYGVRPRPHWATTYYGGHGIKMALRKFGSNIIFSNGLRDPFSKGGVLEDLSDSLRAVYTSEGSHCLDLYPSHKTDPQWLVDQRKTEVQIMEQWLADYYDHLN